jgi:hypothetical protein
VAQVQLEALHYNRFTACRFPHANGRAIIRPVDDLEIAETRNPAKTEKTPACARVQQTAFCTDKLSKTVARDLESCFE